MLYLARIAAASGTGADVLVEGCAYGSLSMTSYTVGSDCLRTSGNGEGSAPPSIKLPAEASSL